MFVNFKKTYLGVARALFDPLPPGLVIPLKT